MDAIFPKHLLMHDLQMKALEKDAGLSKKAAGTFLLDVSIAHDAFFQFVGR